MLFDPVIEEDKKTKHATLITGIDVRTAVRHINKYNDDGEKLLSASFRQLRTGRCSQELKSILSFWWNMLTCIQLPYFHISGETLRSISRIIDIYLCFKQTSDAKVLNILFKNFASNENQVLMKSCVPKLCATKIYIFK
jgi:hypothetical protein